MMLRCAACISSGSASAIAFNAAWRSPLLIASSTLRTAPRIWVRRDLLTIVRRAILRVAFLAELVLAMFSISFGGTAGDRARTRRRSTCEQRSCEQSYGVFWGAPDDAGLWKYAQPRASLKEQRRRDFARRHWPSYRGPVL